jgi:hypothetical protein
MSGSVHEWIENNEDFEAVFQCLNPLDVWEKNASVRAFQTFDWNDASVGGDELTFAHEGSAVMIQYDGDIVAVKFGNGRLCDALPDLFDVLTGLGWQFAEVHHPARSMSALMGDIGRAIPASMKFDVCPAKASIEISSFAESASLMKYGTAALRMDPMSTVDDVVLGELESMTPPQAGTYPVKTAVAAQHQNVLADDVGDHEDDHVSDVSSAHSSMMQGQVEVEVARPLPVSPQPEIAVPAPRADVLTHNNYPQECDELVASAVQHLTLKHSNIQAALVIENENLRDALALANDRLNVEQEHARRLQEEQANRHSPWLLPEQIAPVASTNAHFAVDIFNDIPMPNSNSVVHVGASALCFDLPSNPLSEEAVQQIAVSVSALQIVHVRPGASGESMRWDIFGDISPEYPWGAQQLACSMGFSRPNSALVASIFLEVKERILYAELRDVLSICASSGFDSKVKMDQMLEGVVSPGMKTLFSRLSSTALTAVLDEIVLNLGNLLLCPQGRAFFDIRCASDEITVKKEDVFSMRELMQSPVARLFVIHVDSLDGPFVTWIADLLRDMAFSYSSTTRYGLAGVDAAIAADAVVDAELVEQVNQGDETEIEKNQTLLAEVKAAANDLILQLRRLGMTA